MRTVLVVDDEASLRRSLRAFLERGGFEVMEAASGRAALDLLDGGPPIDAMVVDVVMPELSGLAFYDELSLRAPQLASRVVFFTGSQDPKVHGPIEQRGVPVISKLDDFRLVVDAVRVALLRE